MSAEQAAHPDFAAFTITNHIYKHVQNTPIALSLLLPRAALSSTTPLKLIIRLHGGFLITGSRLDAAWFPTWILDLALATPAAIVSPDYRLLPEATGLDILDDLHDVIGWIGTTLPACIPAPVTVDTSCTLAVGESAGGWLATQSFLTAANLHPAVRFRAVISQYGVLDPTAPFFTTRFDKPILGTPQLPEALVTSHIAQVAAEPGQVITEGSFEGRGPLALSTVQNGRFLEMLGSDPRLNPMANVKTFAGPWPRVLLYSGTADSAVPYQQSVAFGQAVEERMPGKSKVALKEGAEHGFDNDLRYDGWIAEQVKWVVEDW